MIPSPRDEFLKSIISAPSVGQEVLRVAMVPKIDVSHGYKMSPYIQSHLCMSTDYQSRTESHQEKNLEIKHL